MKKVLSESIVTHHGSLPDQDSDGEEKSDSTFSKEATYGDIHHRLHQDSDDEEATYGYIRKDKVFIKQNTLEIKNNLTEKNKVYPKKDVDKVPSQHNAEYLKALKAEFQKAVQSEPTYGDIDSD